MECRTVLEDGEGKLDDETIAKLVGICDRMIAGLDGTVATLDRMIDRCDRMDGMFDRMIDRCDRIDGMIQEIAGHLGVEDVQDPVVGIPSIAGNKVLKHTRHVSLEPTKSYCRKE